MDRNVDEVLSWRDRLVKMSEDDTLQQEVLVMAGVGDKYALNNSQQLTKRLKEVELKDKDVVTFIDTISRIVGKTVDRYPTIASIYKEEIDSFEPTEAWQERVSEDLSNLVLARFHKNFYKVGELATSKGTVGTVITASNFDKLFYQAVNYNMAAVDKNINESVRKRIVVLAMQKFVTKVVLENNYIGLVSVYTGNINPYIGPKDGAFERLVTEYKIRVDHSLSMLITEKPFELPCVYLPRTVKSAKRFLTLYRQIGFNNDFGKYDKE